MDDFDITKPVTNNKVRDLLEKRARIADAASQEMSDCMNELLDEIAFHARFLTVASMTGRRRKCDHTEGYSYIIRRHQ